MNIPKRTIDEVKAKLLLEKDIKEIYVEGFFDRDLIKWVLINLNLEHVRVYPITSIDLQEEELKKLDLTNGNRQRVIATAALLKDIKNTHSQVIFLIDADLDYILEIDDYPPPLKRTTYTCIDLLLWKKSILERFLSLTLGKEVEEAFFSDLIQKTEDITKQTFLFRAAKEKIGVNWRLVDIADQIDKNNKFCFATYCNKIGDKNSARKIINEEFQDVLRSIEEKSKKLNKNKKIHGHDLINVLAKILRNKGFNQSFLKNHDEFSRILLTNIEWKDVKEEDDVEMISKHFSSCLPT